MVRFNNEINSEIRRTVRNFNSKVQRNKTKTRGKGMLPRKISVKEIKEKYSDKSKTELMKQLKLYQSFGKRDALDIADGSRLSKWEKNFFEANLAKTEEFYKNEIADLERIIDNKPQYHIGLNERLTNLQRQQEQLSKNLSSLSEDEIKAMRGVFNYAERSDLVKEKAFRHYLNQLERTMDNLGYSKQEINTLLNKFNVLSENEFTELIRNEDVLDSVYDLIDSPKSRGKFELMTDEERARAIVTDIENRVDELVIKYKKEK